ncbi:MAG: DNA/RNA nuclease SfsA [Magnetococcales bacterium]|nr:DNA/RNA nuclease SfsA [Magnetococcales bacterium]MBF0438610.1 DNA/RNA nuclease SfsA [Magnetococcales bacterium]
MSRIRTIFPWQREKSSGSKGRSCGWRVRDAVTKRGRNHLHLLQRAVADQQRAVQLFVVQREDCQWFAPAIEIDPLYAETLCQARDAGVEVLVYDCSVTPAGIAIRNPVLQKF